MAQKTGALVFDEHTDRFDIRFDLASYYGGLHCGECFDVFAGGKWKPTRIEMSASQEWLRLPGKVQRKDPTAHKVSKAAFSTGRHAGHSV